MSNDGRYGVTVIAFVGSVFSPYYAATGRGNPDNHCALNVAIYRPRSRELPRANRWSMTERGACSVVRTATNFVIGPSAMAWDGEALTISIDEFSFPIPGRLRGTVRLHPHAITDRAFALDADRTHQWWPIAPRARIEVDMSVPDCRFTGTGYLDENFGATPLEDAFERWDWSRATIGNQAVILYDIQRRSGDRAALALEIDRNGNVGAFEPPQTVSLPATPIWRVPRKTQAENGDAKILQTLEDTPFYGRSEIHTRLLDHDCIAMHESIALNRLRSPIVKSFLPWRMPRAVWDTGQKTTEIAKRFVQRQP